MQTSESPGYASGAHRSGAVPAGPEGSSPAGSRAFDESRNGVAAAPGTGADGSVMLTFPAKSGGGYVSVPLLVVQAIDAAGESVPAGTAAPIPPEMAFPLSAGDAGELTAVLVYRPDQGPGFLLLAPSGWKAQALVGADGSLGATFTDPEDPRQTLTYTDTAGSCQGCAISGIGTCFPAKAQWAEEQGFPVYEPLTFVSWWQTGESGKDARTARYTLLSADPDREYHGEGAVYYEEGEWGILFRRLEFRLKPGSSPSGAAGAVLDFFAHHHGALTVEPPVQSNQGR